ncbi:MAG: cell division protein ZapA [candidate division WOR-3 bacterium]|jgi:cell division protein ZapA (FtsZ GTPase activity inhibitor)
MSKNETRELTLHIFGKDFFIMTDADEEYTKKVAEYLTDEMNSIAKNFSGEKYEKIVVIASLNIIDKYFTLQKQYEEMEEKLNDLLEKIK